MLFFVLIVSGYLWCACVYVIGAPPIRPIAEVGDAARLFLKEHVSTELTLGSSSAPVAQLEQAPTQRLHPFIHSDLSPFRGRPPASRPDFTSPPIVGALPTGPDRAFSIPSAEIEGPSSSSVDAVSADRWLQQRARFTSEQDLDIFFNDLLLRDRRTGVWRLPQTIDYVPSSWFDATYASYVEVRRASRNWGRQWTYPVKFEMTLNLFRLITVRGHELFGNSARIYKLRFAGNAANHWRSGEVLVRYLSVEFEGHGVKIPPNTLIVWKTSGQGSRLAFVGLYHCPKALMAEFRRLPGSRKFDVSSLLGQIDLVPRYEAPRLDGQVSPQ
ncbi:hypothetical protein PSEUBRA_004049 [Kalmanozyma brasiliensis GHG001]|uniref:uncharacterized protein n=1 Tax=Kalmanozyma brasiliensis (strain GHG001) TaxID=1365824 RepID=UPI0028680D7A|nr:uncharacterized protein PSEUBRA_004049 [Kalmanozyma brasiliensis GHG001]KAF6767334.1 hypothetical protein PSEUBRA_004049 [Kalmanozyma brasiliensis GHG001]